MDPRRFRGIPISVYCSLDKIDLAATVDGEPVAMQTDHRTAAEIEAEPELSALYAIARVANARSHLAEDGRPTGAVHYVLAGDPPPVLRAALTAVGATVERTGEPETPLEHLGAPSPEAVNELADRCFADLARRVASRVGTRDVGMALRMLEDQTFADPPPRDDEPAYWQRVLDLAALAGELLRAKYPGSWVHSDRSLVPFGYQIDATGPGGATVMFPTNRAQRVIEDGADESLFKLILAVDETMQRPPDAATGRLMPSLRDRRTVELGEIVWQTLLEDRAPPDVPIVVFGIDGESTFGMIRRETLRQPAESAMEEALRNLADEEVHGELTVSGDLEVVIVSGSFYAAEKILDHAFMLRLHDRLRADLLAAAVPTRGVLFVTAATADPSRITRFASLVASHHEAAGGRAISPTVLLVSGGRIAGYVDDSRDRAEPSAESPAETAADPAGPLRRLRGGN